LSAPLADLRPSYDVIVVGSGYGGGVAASRLARAGRSVCVLERGREFVLGAFPDTNLEAAEDSQASLPGTPAGRVGSPLALFDFHVEGECSVLRGCGLGGTSLINAGVAIEPDQDVFSDPAWPAALREDPAGLRQGLDAAKAMLGPRLYPDDWPRLPKQEALRASAQSMGETFARVPVNVAFEDHEAPTGVRFARCTLCGDCVTGCNHGAKKTVAATYLPDAWNHGASIFTEVAVSHVARGADGRWEVHADPVGAGRDVFEGAGHLVVRAAFVVLAAGSLGSTEILLRSGARGLSLSRSVGRRFSGNADVLGFAYNCDVRIDGVGNGARPPDPRRPIGPTITSMIDGRHQGRPPSQRWIVQEGALPGTIDAIYPAGFRQAARWGIDTDGGLRDRLEEEKRELRSRLPDGARSGAVAHTLTFLGMGHDSASGAMTLDESGALRIRWPGAAREPIVHTLHAAMHRATAALGGTWVPNPAWANPLKSGLLTVHPLGGCPMGDDAATGAVDHRGRVFAASEGDAVHDGLFVMDGSVVPLALGANPLLTITALAERSVAHLAAERGWTVDARPGRPSPPRVAPPPPAVGVRFTERMRGHLRTEGPPTDRDAIGFVLTLHAEDLAATLADPDRRMRLYGTVDAPALSPAPMQVTDGRFHLLNNDPTRLETRTMVYAMTLVGADGRRWAFRGVKVVHDDRGPDLWSDTTTLDVTIHGDDGAELRATLRISIADFARQVRTLATTHARSATDALLARVRFGRFFFGSLFDIYGDVFARPTAFDPDAPPRKRRPLRAGPPEIHPFRASDGAPLLLTRYRGGPKGPVVLVHGLGVSSGIFTLDTVDVNLVEALTGAGYDVWLLDTRASVDGPTAASASNADQLAAIDLPEGVACVRARTGAPSVQVVAHCYGATAFYMSVLSGALTGVRAAVTSQATPIVRAATQARLKSGLHLPGALEALGVDQLTAYTDTMAGWANRLYDRALSLYPVQREERCRSATCRRVTFMYATLFEHDRISPTTHDTLHELFGVAPLSAFRHLARMVRAGSIVDVAGRDVYLPHVARLSFPLLMVHGEENACFSTEGTHRTLAWLRQHHGDGLHAARIIPGYGHIDCVLGEGASEDVFPHVLAHLEAHP
jgi:cholesterol oxidase